jgi:hypothetical protein
VVTLAEVRYQSSYINDEGFAMLATDEETLLKDFLDEEVPCEYLNEGDGHAADVYASLVCPHCSNESTVWSSCNDCLAWARIALVVTKDLDCIECKRSLKPIEMLTVKGSVR